MNEDTARRGWRRWGGVAAIAAVGLLAGAVIAGTVTATADPTTTPSAPDSAAADAQDPRAPGGGRPGGGRPGGESRGGEAGGEPGGEPRDESRSQRPDEQLLTGETADRVTAAALASFPGATIQRVETDSDGVYEAHLVTAEGTRVTVEVGEDFTVTGEEAGGPPR